MPWYKQLIYNIQHHWHIFVAAWREQNRQPAQRKLTAKERQFLPAQLEIIETPASPIGRTIGGVIILLFVLAVIWASVGKIDIVAIAQGKIIPSDHTKVIQPFETSKIKAIHVSEGQQVKKGDVLIALDATDSSADQARLHNEYQAKQLKAARLQALIAGEQHYHAPENIDPAVVALQQQLLSDQHKEQQARIQTSQLAIEQQQAALAATELNITRLEETIPLLEERAKAVKQMHEKKFVSRVQYLEIEEQRINKVQELAAQRQQLIKDQAALASAKQHHAVIQSEFNKTQQAELAEVQTQIHSLAEELAKAKNRTGNQNLTAPINGVVQQLAVHTVGGVVTPAQTLMVIVPQQAILEVEAWVENKDIGFVDTQQKAEIKVEAFPFTKYGTIDAKVVNLSKDAIHIENTGYVYAARLSMARSIIDVGNKQVHLSPGMNVTVEIKTGQRRLIEFFLSPLLRGMKESAKER